MSNEGQRAAVIQGEASLAMDRVNGPAAGVSAVKKTCWRRRTQRSVVLVSLAVLISINAWPNAG